jgi:ribonuclease P protein component
MSVAMQRLRQRADFLAAASGRKVPTATFVLQARRRDDDGPARIGFTVSKKVGTAVERNRVRRRLREIVRRASADSMRPGHDYVLIGRRAALLEPFAQLEQAVAGALRRAHAESFAPKGRPAQGETPYRRRGRPDKTAP